MFTVEQLLDDATAEAGLQDFGPATFRAGLEQVVEGLDDEADLTDIGEMAAQSMLHGLLVTRLRMEQWWAEHPELADQPVEAPWLIVGSSRTGTTALSHLLSCDPGLRSLRQWEVSDPFPPPTDVGYDSDPRYRAALAAPSGLDLVNPSFKAIHHDPADMPIECVTSLAHEFVSLQLNSAFHLPSYVDWVLDVDQGPAYAWHDRLLRVLGSHTVGRWQLKTPHHGLAIDTVRRQWPDSRCLVTHRDPIECVASTVSLLNSLTGSFSDVEHRSSLARYGAEMVATIIERVVDHRQRVGDEGFVDIAYRSLVDDPVATVASLYDDLDVELEADTEAAMQAHAGAHRQHRHGTHDYDLDALGLDRAALTERFEPYTARYGQYL